MGCVDMVALPSFPRYRVAADGSGIWSDKQNRWLTPSKSHGGHTKYGLSIDGKLFNVSTHRAVAEAFLGPAPEGACVEHIDGDISNNHPSNLRYATLVECNARRTRKSMAAYIECNSVPVPWTGCWLWELASDRYGYGKATALGRKSTTAHRISYEAFVGPIPEGMFVCHKCDVAACCNPEHLFLGTAADNNRDRSNKGRTAKGPRSSYKRLFR